MTEEAVEEAVDPMKEIWDGRPLEIQVGDYMYTVILWEPGMTMFTDPFLAVDTETEAIIKGESIKPVIMQVCSLQERRVHIVLTCHMGEYCKQLLVRQQELVFHNAPFDLHVLEPFVGRKVLVDMVQADLVTDTSIRYILHMLTLGRDCNKYNLEIASKNLLHIVISKDESLRLTFKVDMDLTIGHTIYAASDSIVTALLRELLKEPYPTEGVQVTGYIALSSIGNQGMLVDLDRLHEVRDKLRGQIDERVGVMGLFGYRPGEKGNTKVMQEILEIYEKRAHVRISQTEKTGQRQTSEKALSVFRDMPPFLECFLEYEHLNKMIKNFCKEELIGTDGRVHPNFSPLVKTGRTSCSKPNLQQVPRKEGLRSMYIPPPGYVLYAVDYAQLELCALAHNCLKRFGKSRMAEIINSGEDIHKWFGNIVKAQDPRSEDEKETVNFRQMAKAANFGYPGGLGAATFKGYAKGYGVDISEDQCEDLKALWLEAFPEMEYHLKPDEDSMWSNKEETWYIARTVSGRIRRKATFCSACNYPFQGLAADGAKVALWYLYREAYRMVNFIHDEVIIELSEDTHMQEHVKRIDYLMIAGMRSVIDTVNIRVEGALMRRWEKDAEPVFGEDGSLLVWTG
jgi:DNA polymerase I-like protein with 3'-5' exonuclease and polymerase domains